MKETRYFFVPDAISRTEMPEDEAMHALRVLRLKIGDEMILMDGAGNFYNAEVTLAATRRCLYEIKETIPQPLAWKGHLHIAIAPTKLMDKMEWFAEKVTEIGVNELSFLNCQFSERKIMRTTRLDKIVISAVKQSRKAWKPVLNQMVTFKSFINEERPGRKFIAHCYDEVPKKFLFDELQQPSVDGCDDVTVLVGPEGDFSIDEVKLALAKGYESISLGKSRLRTETAGIIVAEMMQLCRM